MEQFIGGLLAATIMMSLIFLGKYLSKTGWEVDLQMAPDEARLVDCYRKMQGERSIRFLNIIGSSLVAVGVFMIALCIFADVPEVGWENFVGGVIYLIGVSLWMRPYDKAADQYYREIGLAP